MSAKNSYQLPRGWAETTLGAIQLDVATGVDPTRAPYTMFELYSVPSHEQGMPEIISGNQIGSNKRTVEQDTVLLCKINPRINRVWIVGSYSEHLKIASTEWLPFFPISGLDPRYLAHYLRQNQIRDYLASNASGVGGSLMRVRAATLKELNFRVAPKIEQMRIAETLDELFSELDAGVAALDRARHRLNVYRASVLKAAVEGTLTADWRAAHPHTETASELLKRVLAERRRRWEEEQLRKFAEKGKVPPKNWRARYKEPDTLDTTDLPCLPEGWEWASFGQCFGVRVGATPRRSVAEYWHGDIPWIASGEVQFMPIVETREQITSAGLANSNTQVNPKGSVILNMIGEGKTRGKAAVLEIEACNNQNCAAIWVSQTPISPKYIYYWLVYHYEETRKLGSGNNQPAMNKSIVESIVFPMPPVEEQNTIVDIVDEKLSIIDLLVVELDTKLATSESLRQAILRQAFAGSLVPQDPKDEPASKLLERVADEREARAREAAATKRTARIKKGGRASRKGWPRKTVVEAAR